MTVLLFFAFVSGLITIAAPCIWPLLPIILSSSILGSDHRRPLGITLGILVSFGILTLTISYLVSIFRFDPEILRYVAVAVLLFLGVSMVIPPVTRFVEGFVSRFAGRIGQIRSTSSGQAPGSPPSTGFLPGFITGLSLGVVWTPCAGPILAGIATLAATRAVNLEIILVTIVYLIGVGIPLFIFAYAGQRIINRSRAINKYTGNIQKVFGVIMIVTAILILTGYDRVLQAKLLDAFPSYSKFITDLEGNDAVKRQLDVLLNRNSNKSDMVGEPFNPMGEKESQNKIFNANYPAPELMGITGWLNSEPLALEKLEGKVVLIDFWTYTCINCIRTLPYVTGWYEKYKDQGFLVIGVHTPEFEFEKKSENVQAAIEQYEINYPVPQDNDFETWNAFKNRYWPAKYLIDGSGVVRYFHFGEGNYEETEMAIQELLKEEGKIIRDKPAKETPLDLFGQRTPETYLGSLRMEYYFPNGRINNDSYKGLKAASNFPVNSFTLGGDWIVTDEYSESGNNAVLEQKFYADKVYLVMRPKDGAERKVRILLDGKAVDSSNAGIDVRNGFIPVTSDKLYNLIDLRGNRGEHLLRIEFTPGIQIFAFTFG
jgi:cytochrome c biogenesis protein CcdA/thiol-disulfide isomerase/thioredoxin